MHWFANLRLVTKLAVGFGLVLLCLITMGAISIQQAANMNRSSNVIISEIVPIDRASRDLLLQMVNMETGVRGFMVTGQEKTLSAYTNAQEPLAKDLENLSGRYSFDHTLKDLAERSTAATSEVSTLIGRVKIGVEEAMQAMTASSQEVSVGASRSQEAGQALNLILQATQSVATQVENVSANARQMAASVQKVTATVDTVRQSAEENGAAVLSMAAGAEKVSSAISLVASISRNVAAGAEEMRASAEKVNASAQSVSAAVQEQSAGVEEITASASELNNMAARLRDLVRQFRLETRDTSKQLTMRMMTTKADKAA